MQNKSGKQCTTNYKTTIYNNYVLENIHNLNLYNRGISGIPSITTIRREIIVIIKYVVKNNNK